MVKFKTGRDLYNNHRELSRHFTAKILFASPLSDDVWKPNRIDLRRRSRMDQREKEALVREFQVQLDKRLRENEINVIAYWQGHLAKVLAMKPEGVGALQMQVKKVHDMMANRLQALKRGVS